MFKVLLVDDEILVREAISKKIEWNKLGFELVGDCENGADAIEFVKTHPVDLVLTDICMPHVDGMELSRFLYENYPNIAIIIFSGYSDFEYAKQAIQYKVSEYILKPVTAKELSEVLVKTQPVYEGKQITLGDIMEEGEVDEKYFIPDERLYYTYPEVTHSDESKERLSKEERQTWQYIKGAKKLPRKAANGHEYIFSEGAIAMLDAYDKPARTMLTSEGSFSRSTHIVKDKKTGRIRLLTPMEAERIQGFPTDHTKYCQVGDNVVEMPVNKRRFMMGNALVVNLVEKMEEQLSEIFDME